MGQCRFERYLIHIIRYFGYDAEDEAKLRDCSCVGEPQSHHHHCQQVPRPAFDFTISPDIPKPLSDIDQCLDISPSATM